MKPWLETVRSIGPRMKTDELQALYRLAREVPEEGSIVEIGACYGASTACMALAAPSAHVTTIDLFIFHPDGRASAALFWDNMQNAGVDNVTLIQQDSTTILWISEIDLLFIDGAHDYEHVKSDIETFGRWARVIACHDYKRPVVTGVPQAVDEWVAERPEWRIERVVRSLAILRKG